MKKTVIAILVILCIAAAGAFAWFHWAASNTEFHTVEHTPADGLVYFTDVNDPIDMEVNLVKGPQKLDITMDNGEVLRVVIAKGDEKVYEGEIVFTGALDVDIPEDGAYTLTISGKHASGDLKYAADMEKKDRGTLYYD